MITLLVVFAVQTPVVDCSTCLQKGSMTETTVHNYVRECTYNKAVVQQFFSRKNDLHLTKTDGGATITWPDCFDDITTEWDPCETHKVIEVELTCKK